MSDQVVDEWAELPMLLKVEEAARVLRIGRSKAYEMTTLYVTSDGKEGLPVLRMGDVLRVPRFALREYVMTGRIVQLMPQPERNTADHATAARKTAHKRRGNDRAQLSLLGSD